MDRNLVGELNGGGVDGNSGNGLGLFINSHFDGIGVDKGDGLVEGDLVCVGLSSEDVERGLDGDDRRNGDFYG